MESYQETHSTKLSVAVVALLALGLIFLYALPVITESTTNDFGDATTTHQKYGDLKILMSMAGGDWANTLLWIGLVVGAVAAVAFPKTQRQVQAIAVSAGSIAAMAVPFWLSRHLEGASLGIGAILAWIAFAAAAVLPWVLPKEDERQTAYGSAPSSAAARYMPTAAPPVRQMSLALEPSDGEPGASARVRGNGFTPGRLVSVLWLGLYGSRQLGEPVASAAGEIDLVFTAPSDQPPGEYTIRAMTPNGLRVTAPFTVLSGHATEIGSATPPTISAPTDEPSLNA